MSGRSAAFELAGETVPEEKPAKGQKQRQEARGGFKELDYLDPEHDAVEAIGISPADAKETGIGFAPRGAGKGSVMIPIRLSCGTCIGYVGVQELTFTPKEWRYPGGN